MSKEELRRFYLQKRGAREDAARAELNAAFRERLLSLEAIRNAPLILAFSAVRGEIDLTDFYKKIRTPLAFPRTFGAGKMEFALATPDELVTGRYNIPEPPKERFALSEFPTGTVCLVPALAFDEEGYRLGYGGGYYDRFLKDFTGLSVGIADALCERLPRNEFDCSVSMIVHEGGILTPHERKAILW